MNESPQILHRLTATWSGSSFAFRYSAIPPKAEPYIDSWGAFGPSVDAGDLRWTLNAKAVDKGLPPARGRRGWMAGRISMPHGAKTQPKPYPLLGTGQTPLWAVFIPDVETCPCRPPIDRLQPHGRHLPLGIGRARSDLWID